jgi:lipoate-protein ligase A
MQQAALDKNELLEKATTIEDVLGTPPSWEDAASAFINAFSKTLNISFTEEDLSSEECFRVQDLVIKKYTHPDWTGRI